MPGDFTRGIEAFQKKLHRMAENAKALDGEHKVPFPEVFTPAFMQQHTRVATFEALLAAGGFHVESPEDFAAIPDDKWEEVVRSHTSFPNWLEMQKAAGAEWMAAQLQKGV